MPSKRIPSPHRALKLSAPRSLYFAIFAVSGFSGLIYESIWTHYLKLFLGHAAYAQSLYSLSLWAVLRWRRKSSSNDMIG